MDPQDQIELDSKLHQEMASIESHISHFTPFFGAYMYESLKYDVQENSNRQLFKAYNKVYDSNKSNKTNTIIFDLIFKRVTMLGTTNFNLLLMIKNVENS